MTAKCGRAMRWGFGATLALAATGVWAQEPATAEQLAASAKSTASALTAMAKARDRLVGELDARAAAEAKGGVGRDLVLRLPEGADHEDAEIVLRQRGGSWLAAYGVVPAWRQEGFFEKFQYRHRGGTRAATRDVIRHAVDASALRFDGSRLAGEISAAWRINELRDERFPPGTPVRWKNTGEKFSQIELLSELVHQTPRHQRYTLDAAVVPGAYEFCLEIEKFSGGPAVYATVQVPCQPWLRGTAKTPYWNCGFHTPDASGLVFRDGKLTGTLKVLLTPDAWFPKAPQVAVYVVDGEAKHGVFRGTYKVSGTLGEAEGAIRGQCGAFVRGIFRAAGEMGSFETEVYGRVREPAPKAAALLPADPPAPAGDAAAADALRAQAARLAALYHRVRALSLALRQYPLPLEEALDQTVVPAPQWAPGAALTAAHADDIAAWSRDLADLAARAAGETPAFVTGVPPAPSPDFGPFFEPAALAVDSSGACVLPAPATTGPQQWAYLPTWRWFGPAQITDDLDNDAAVLPDLVPARAAVYPVFAERLPKVKGQKTEDPLLRGWTVSFSNTSGQITVPWSDEPGRGRGPGSLWYACGELVSDTDREAWIGVAARDHGKLWVNGKLAWTGEEPLWRAYDKREAVFKIALQKGVNRLLLRVREDRAWTWARFLVCVRGEPGTGPTAAAATSAASPPAVNMLDERGDGNGHFPEADPPLAWDLAKGVNVAWKRKLDVRAPGGIVAAGERLFVRAEPYALLCLDAKNGETLWRKDTCALELTDKDAFAKWEACKTDEERNALLASLKVPATGAVCSPVTDGKTVWVCYATGATAAYDTNGKRLWIAMADTSPGSFRVTDGLVLLEGGGGGKSGGAHRLLALDAASGAEKWRRDFLGAYNRGALHLLRVSGHGRTRTVALTSDLIAVDPLTGRTLLSRVDADPSEGSTVYVADNDLFFGKLTRTTGMRFFLDADGQLGQRFLFRTHYGAKYDRPAPCFAMGPWFMVVCTVQEDCKGHSNAAVRELYAYDRTTGMPVKRIKPVLEAAQTEFRPTSAGPYVFVQDSGGGGSGGRADAGQFAVVRADGTPRLLAQNLVDLGDAAPPSFAGKRMFLRVRDTIVCFAALSDEGRRFEQERVAETLFADVRQAPVEETFTAPTPMAAAPARPARDDRGAGGPARPARDDRGAGGPDPATVPVTRFASDIGLLEWIAAGPLPCKPLAEDPALAAKLAALSPAAGASLEMGGKSAAFAAVPLRQTSSMYSYGHSYYLCGIGGTTADLKAEVDVASLTGGEADSCAVLYTVVRNAREQVVSLIAPPVGADIWLAGRKVRAFDTLRLAPGLYPLLLRVDPAKTGAKIAVSFRVQDDPVAARRAWLRGVNAAEDDLAAVARALPDTPQAATVADLMSQLDVYKAELDLQQTTRMAANDGTATFRLARPPAPWERTANVRWAAPLTAATGSAPVAGGDRVFVGVVPATLVCLGVAKGESLWTKPVGRDDAKNSVSAPAVDAGRVFTVTGIGEAACVRAHDGSTVWTRSLPDAAAPSFAAIAGKVFVAQAGALYGLDAAGGKVLWTKKLAGDAAGVAPVPVKLGTVPAVLTGAGDLLDARDGHSLGAIGRSLPGCRPCRVGSLVCLATPEGKIAASPLPGGSGGWEVAAGGRVTAGLIESEGILHFVTDDAELRAIRAADGTDVWRQKLPTGGRDIRLTLAGRHVYVSNVGPDTRTVVFQSGAAYRKVWEYAVPGGAADPFFLGRDAFVRAGVTLFCVGGEPPRDPGAFAEPPMVTADAAFQPAAGAPVVSFESNVMPGRWLVAAPLKPRTIETDLLAALGGRAKANPAVGTKVAAGGKEVEFRALTPACIWRDVKFTSGFDALELVEAVGKDWNSTAYYYTVIENDSPRIVEVRVLTPGGIQWNAKDRLEAAMWVGGTPVREGDVVRLPAGKFPLLVQAGVGELKTSGKIWMAPRFVDCTGRMAGALERLQKQKAVWEAFQKTAGEWAVLKKD